MTGVQAGVAAGNTVWGYSLADQGPLPRQSSCSGWRSLRVPATWGICPPCSTPLRKVPPALRAGEDDEASTCA